MNKGVSGYLYVPDMHPATLEKELEVLLCEACARLQAKLSGTAASKKKNYAYVKISLQGTASFRHLIPTLTPVVSPGKNWSDIESFIRTYLDHKDWTSPTEIGHVYGNSRGSAWASPKCKRLAAQGYLLRNKDGKYKLAVNVYGKHLSKKGRFPSFKEYVTYCGYDKYNLILDHLELRPIWDNMCKLMAHDSL